MSPLSNTEKFAAAVAACAVAVVVLDATWNLGIPPRYADFVVGRITWDAGSKLQDLISLPSFVLALFLAFLFLSHALIQVRNRFGADRSARASNQLLWWSAPGAAVVFNFMPGVAFDAALLALSASAVLFMGIAAIANTQRAAEFDPERCGLFMLAILLLALIPLETALVLGRAAPGRVGEVDAAAIVPASYALFSVGMLGGVYLVARWPEKLFRILPTALMIGQIGACAYYLTLFPAQLLLPSGEITRYDTSIWLKVLIGGLIAWSVFDVIMRYRKHAASEDWSRLLAPVALFALLLALKVGNTRAPMINPDDYHFGENLLGWWLYLKGAIPYVDYFPAKGFTDNDLAGLSAALFYDGSAGSLLEAARLVHAILALIAFLAIIRLSGSLPLAIVCIFFLRGRLAWFVLAAVLFVWLARALRAEPAKWLAVWVATAPLIILAVPPQGTVLVAASGILVLRAAWAVLRSGGRKDWSIVGLSLLILACLAFFTPLGMMLLGAVRYVVENGAINQVAYGMVWKAHWGGNRWPGLSGDVVRMSWIAIPIACLMMIHANRGEWRRATSEIYPALVILIFCLLMVPYSMGRLEEAHISRAGLLAILGWTVLLPMLLWPILKPQSKAPFALLIVCMSALLNYGVVSSSGLLKSIANRVKAPTLTDSQSAGLGNIGRSHVQKEHWDRLNRLGALMDSKLGPEETYLDLTNRNAQYFYLNRRPPVAVTAPYNMVGEAQQRRALETLAANPPPLALLEGQNINHDGGGLALRTHLLYRFVIDNYIPKFENGFIIGYRSRDVVDSRPSEIEVAVKAITDKNWQHGLYRNEAAFVVDDLVALSFIKPGDRIRVGADEVRRVLRVSKEGASVWLDGASLVGAPGSPPRSMHLLAGEQRNKEYRMALLQRAFSAPELGKVPVAWGRSEPALADRMTLVKEIEASALSPHQFAFEDGGYRIQGNDPQIIVDLSGAAISGREAGLLKFDFECLDRKTQPRIEVYWWGDERERAYPSASLRFTADDGTLIVPLDAFPSWLLLRHVKGVRIDLDNAGACRAIRVEKLGLYQRRL